jgi:hypothetical protein
VDRQVALAADGGHHRRLGRETLRRGQVQAVGAALHRARDVTRVEDGHLEERRAHARMVRRRLAREPTPRHRTGGMMGAMDNALLFDARARVLADLDARGVATATAVSALEDAVAQRKWWAEQWPEGEVYVAGLVAQDVQDALLETVGRWPLCHDCGDHVPSHSLYIQPDLGGPDPVWVCEETGDVVAPLGGL